MEQLKKEINKIKMSESAKQRILNKCREKINFEQENYGMNKKILTSFKKPLIVVATLAICLCLTGITAMAATGKGFFRDTKRLDGVITGQIYHTATDEVLVYAAVENDMLNITVEMVKIELFPYREIEVLELKNYRVFDKTGTIVLENSVPENVTMENNQVKFQVPAKTLTEGTYKLTLDVLSGSKNADQDLLIYGEWECEFTK